MSQAGLIGRVGREGKKAGLVLALLTLVAGISPAAARTHRTKPPAAPPVTSSESKPAPEPASPPSPAVSPSSEIEPPPASLANEPRAQPGAEVEPPPAPLTEPEPPEPPPAPLVTIEQPPKEIVPLPADTRGLQRGLRGTAWVGVAATLSLVTAGIVLGVLTQQRSDALSLSTVQQSGGLPPIYDAVQHQAYTDLQSQGQTFNNATIACFAVGGALALTSGILFWNAARLQGKSKSLALRSIGVSAGGGMVLTGSF